MPCPDMGIGVLNWGVSWEWAWGYTEHFHSAMRLRVCGVIVCGNPLYMSDGMLPHSDWVKRQWNLEFGSTFKIGVHVCNNDGLVCSNMTEAWTKPITATSYTLRLWQWRPLTVVEMLSRHFPCTQLWMVHKREGDENAAFGNLLISSHSVD